MKLPAFLSKTDLITPRNFENRFVNICYGAMTYKDIMGKLWVFYYAYHAVKHDKEFFSCVNKLLVTGSLMSEESKLQI